MIRVRLIKSSFRDCTSCKATYTRTYAITLGPLTLTVCDKCFTTLLNRLKRENARKSKIGAPKEGIGAPKSRANR